jgi:predicted membrane-bound spermidine synthase
MSATPTGPGSIGELGCGSTTSTLVAAERQRSVPFWILVAFFLSGFAALVYQVVWQRSLFTIFGVNIESVTLVVTVFMLGLGLGSLAGGALSKRGGRPLLLWFSIIELAIGCFGVISLDLFEGVGNATLGASPLLTGIATFLLLLPPTLMMGSTLPLLVTLAVIRSGNVGRAVGLLYFVNTLGSAFAAVATVLFLMRALGQQRSVFAAAALNATVAAVAFIHYMRERPPR